MKNLYIIKNHHRFTDIYTGQMFFLKGVLTQLYGSQAWVKSTTPFDRPIFRGVKNQLLPLTHSWNQAWPISPNKAFPHVPLHVHRNPTTPRELPALPLILLRGARVPCILAFKPGPYPLSKPFHTYPSTSQESNHSRVLPALPLFLLRGA